MVGRGSYGRPWFIDQVRAWLSARRRIPDPPLAAQLAIIEAHYDDMLSHYGTDVGVRIARKHVGWYSKGLPGSAEFRAAVNQTAEPRRVKELIRAFYEPLLAAPAPRRVRERAETAAETADPGP
jgi:tRNA-dihydrouridine synthase B